VSRNQGTKENQCAIRQEEIVPAFGDDYSITRHELEEVDLVTTILKDCDDQDGNYERLTYRNKGMSALFDENGLLVNMEFPEKYLTRGNKLHLPCNNSK
jgi:hypothetical protein